MKGTVSEAGSTGPKAAAAAAAAAVAAVAAADAGAGKDPAPDRHAAINLSRYLLNNGLESLRMPRPGH